MRLIDADELKKALAEMWYESAISITGVSVSELIDNAPTIEPCKSTDQNVADVPIDDLVSRAEVLALINKAMYNTDNKDIQDYIFCGLRRDVHNLPSAEYSKPLQTTLNDDLISKAEAIEAVVCDIWHTPAEERYLFKWENYIRAIVERAINKLPSVDMPKDRPKGEWVRYKRCDPVGDEIYAVMEAPDGKFFCNQCGKSAIKSDFCPHCGADMRP